MSYKLTTFRQAAEASVPQKPDKTYSSPMNSSSTVDGDSYFFSYFMMLCIIIVLFYVGYHNKQKVNIMKLRLCVDISSCRLLDPRYSPGRSAEQKTIQKQKAEFCELPQAGQ